MGATVSAESARKSAPASEVRSVDGERDDAPLTLEARAASALAARAYGSYPAPEGVPADIWARECAATEVFDREHATDFVAIHDAFAHAYRDAYLRPYTRTLHSDWSVLRLLVREHNPAFALVLVDRAFSEPLLVGAGIETPVIVLNWAGTLGATTRRRSRLSRPQASLCRRVIAENARGGA